MAVREGEDAQNDAHGVDNDVSRDGLLGFHLRLLDIVGFCDEIRSVDAARNECQCVFEVALAVVVGVAGVEEVCRNLVAERVVIVVKEGECLLDQRRILFGHGIELAVGHLDVLVEAAEHDALVLGGQAAHHRDGYRLRLHLLALQGG